MGAGKMLRTASTEDIAGSYHIDSLKQAFPYTREAPSPGGGSGEETTFSVEQTASEFLSSGPPEIERGGVGLSTKADLTIYVVLPSGFPEVPPRITTFAGTSIPVEWDRRRSLLADAVRDAFKVLRTWWGPNQQPPTMADVPAVPHFTNDVVDDLLTNQNAFDSYTYQLPYAKGLRTSEKKLLEDLELMADTGLELQLAVEQLKSEVEELWSAAVEHGTQLEEARQDAAPFLQYGTTEMLLKALSVEVQQAQQSSSQLADQQLHATGEVSESTGRAASGIAEELLEDYYDSRVAYHRLELKRRLFAASH